MQVSQDLFSNIIKFLVFCVIGWVGVKIDTNSQELRRLSEKDAQDQVNIQLLIKSSDDLDRAVKLIKDTLATREHLGKEVSKLEVKIDEMQKENGASMRRLWDQFNTFRDDCYPACGRRPKSRVESYFKSDESDQNKNRNQEKTGFTYAHGFEDTTLAN